MEVVIRKSKDDKWGFVESFNVYKYAGCGSISVTVGISPEGKLVVPYVFRGEEFIPAQVIDEEMGIEKYIKAKKPFYSNLSDGFVATIKAGVNFETGAFIPETTNYIAYKVSERERVNQISQREYSLKLQRLLEIPESVDTLMTELAKQIASCAEKEFNKGKMRSNFIKMRF